MTIITGFKVNRTMQLMGALQPGLPSLTAISKDTDKIILELKDCFYSIPLAPQDCHRFAFSIPSVNFKSSKREIIGRFLPQGRANSATFLQVYIIHYMDDILLAH